MSNRNKHVSNVVKCKCNKCGWEAQALPEAIHRRCGGTGGAPPVKRGEQIKVTSRGKWEAA